MPTITSHQPLGASGAARRPAAVAVEPVGRRPARPQPIVTDRLVLEPWHPRHREAWRHMCREPAVMRYLGAGDPWSTARADETFDAMIAHWQEHGFGSRSALHWATGTWLGCITLCCLEADAAGVAGDTAEIGWWLVRPAWGHGYATEAAAAVVKEAFDRLAIGCLVARLQPAAHASARVALRIGMHPDGAAVGSDGELLQVYALRAADRSAGGELSCEAAAR
jgi:RimJ/RimL family protein N-acetyltransferase